MNKYFSPKIARNEKINFNFLSTFYLRHFNFGSGCSNPYVNPDTSKAITEQEQLKELKEQNAMMKEQTIQLKRIADALEKKTGK